MNWHLVALTIIDLIRVRHEYEYIESWFHLYPAKPVLTNRGFRVHFGNPGAEIYVELEEYKGGIFYKIRTMGHNKYSGEVHFNRTVEMRELYNRCVDELLEN